MQGLIIKLISGEYTVIDNNQNEYVCKPRGTFRLNALSPKVGDIVDIDPKTKTILKIHPRKNELIRPFVANIDKVFLIFSVIEPDLNLNLLDRMLSIIEYNNIESIIVFTKIDLINEEQRKELNNIKEYYEKIGYKTYTTGINLDINEIVHEVDDNICCFAGQSGAGKSTLLNRMDSSLELKTQEISKALGRGKHTTRHTELLRFGSGWIADTPGFGNIDFPFEDLLTFSHSFIEFFSESHNCKYKGCLHRNEPNCKVKQLVASGDILNSRYDNYCLFANEVEENIKNKY